MIYNPCSYFMACKTSSQYSSSQRSYLAYCRHWIACTCAYLPCCSIIKSALRLVSLRTFTCQCLPGGDLFSLDQAHVLHAVVYALQPWLVCMLTLANLNPGFGTSWRIYVAPHQSAACDLHCYCNSFALNLIVLSMWYSSRTVSYRLSARRLASFAVMLFTASFHSGNELHSNPLSPCTISSL